MPRIVKARATSSWSPTGLEMTIDCRHAASAPGASPCMKQTGDQITIERLLPLATLAPGKYKLEVSATDALSNQTISRSAEFTVKPSAAPIKTSAANTTPGR